ncbi:hypothetical protein HYQ45_016016 [Verticillium longisporum]|uniref:Uncharacterized protein n=2 Tax=Verticillium TaxID=1036719 RepID=A0A8I2Z7C9_VERLO|nr:hypothetical protein HYQ45_016016 [Verticillium longisporum]RXG46535.1 hypothetical protein VDGE_30588 [Verticillium dahliae]
MPSSEHLGSLTLGINGEMEAGRSSDARMRMVTLCTPHRATFSSTRSTSLGVAPSAFLSARHGIGGLNISETPFTHPSGFSAYITPRHLLPGAV